jgi:hypothetical protein
MQGLSTEATVRLGDPEAFVAHAVAIVANVRAHSPDARAVLFQTWARARTDPFYPYHFPTPLAMHEEVRTNYARAAAAIDAAFGPGTARVARVGDAVALLGFDPAYYNADRSHPGEAMTVLVGMTIYTALWQDPLGDVHPDFAGTPPVPRFFLAHGFKPSLWEEMRGYADLVADRGLRRWPGSGDELLLRSGGGGSVPLTPDARVEVRHGSRLVVEVASPTWRYAAAPAALFAEPLPAHPFPGVPELYVSARALPLAATAELGRGLRVTLPPGLLLPGRSLLLQAVALAPSRITGRALWTTTDGQEVRSR